MLAITISSLSTAYFVNKEEKFTLHNLARYLLSLEMIHHS